MKRDEFHAIYGPTPPEAVVALYDAITDYILMLKNQIEALDEETRGKVDADIAFWREQLKSFDQWDLLDLREVLDRGDAWI